MFIPTEPIGSIPRPLELLQAIEQAGNAQYIPLARLGSTDDCGFSPFSDDTTTSRDTAFAKIEARVRGTALAARALGN